MTKNGMPDAAHHEPFHILSLDGGGIRGIFSATFLAALEEDLGIEIRNNFDLIAGTSTGGIIALALGLDLRPREIVDFYVQHGPAIFPSRARWRVALQWVYRKYSQDPLREALKTCFRDKRFGDSTKRLVVPSYNIGEDDVYIFRTAHHERLRRDYKVPAWKVALATSAAPTYFPTCREIDSIRLVDGGVWANNPTMVAVAEAVETIGVPLSSIRILSLGTSDPITRRPSRLENGGTLAWARGSNAIDVILRGQSTAANNQAKLLLGRDKITRVNPAVAAEQFSLDGVKEAQELIGKAAHVSRQNAPEYTKLFANHTAPPFRPFYSGEAA